MKRLLGLMAMLCIYVSDFGQQSKQLSVGDTVPDIEFNHVLNYKSTTAKLSDFKNKLIMLDFWATWCSTCIHSIPGTDSLQHEFKDNLQVLMVNPKISRDSIENIEKVIGRMNKLLNRKLSVPVVAYDTSATRLFKFRTVPHYVWIKNGIVIAITHKAQVTEANIRAIISGQKISLPVKNDFIQQ